VCCYVYIQCSPVIGHSLLASTYINEVNYYYYYYYYYYYCYCFYYILTHLKLELFVALIFYTRDSS
jgi:hypothetical protein